MGYLALAVYLILTAVNDFGWASISAVVLGIFAFVAGVLMLVEGWGAVDKWRRP